MICVIKYTVPAALLQLLLSIQISVSVFISTAKPQTLTNQTTSSNHHSLSTILVFGDSTVDPGNNNYLNAPTFKSNFPPYGKDFVNHVPTGRFTNGRLVTDFIVSYTGLKDYLPPYLDPTLSIEDLTTGVSFASAGSGFDPLTAALGGMIPIEKQVEYFREYKTRLENAIGKERTNDLIKKAVFVASSGTNDFGITYFGPSSVRRQTYSVSGYQNFLMQNIQQFIQVVVMACALIDGSGSSKVEGMTLEDLLREGAQKIVIVGLPPLGCLPAVITLYSVEAFNGRSCNESLSSIARHFNQMIQTNLNNIQILSTNAKIFYADIYNSVNQIIKSPKKYGFDEVNIGCCGTGYIETSYLCNSKSTICPDASKYVFWDSIHPTEKAYNIIFKGLHSTIDLVLNE